LKVLTRGQRSKYEKLLGPPFAPDAVFKGLNARSGPGGDRPRDAEAKADTLESDTEVP
jgi:hypothetical protein